MKTQSTIIEMDESGVIRLPATLRAAWNPMGKMEAAVVGHQLVISPVDAESDLANPTLPAVRVAALREWVAKLPRHHREALSDQAVSRDTIYD